jgi:hypothetical protein
MRSVRPSGGLLSDGDPAPAAAPEFNALVNKERDEKSVRGPLPREGEQEDTQEHFPGERADRCNQPKWRAKVGLSISELPNDSIGQNDFSRANFTSICCAARSSTAQPCDRSLIAERLHFAS